MKNIILLITDTFRYDNLGDRASKPVRTPELDRFAAERATAIEGFYTASFPTIPHRTDLATGRLGWPHYPWQPIERSSANHIAALLRQQGYATQLICDCPHLFKAGFEQAFDAALQHRGQEGDRALLHLNDPIETVMPHEKTRERPMWKGHTLADAHRWANRYYCCEMDGFYAKTGGTASRWLEENYQAGPFFLWVDFFDPHEPWDPPEYLVRRYDPDYDGTPMLHPNYGPIADYSEAELHNLWAHYAAESEMVDRWIGRVLQKLDDLQLWDDTIVAITSDHGTSLGDHGRTGKTNIHRSDQRYWPIYPEIGHVPFLLGGGEVPAGVSLDVIAQPEDILPSLCELAGVEIDPPEPMEGCSFAKAVLEGQMAHREYAISGSHISPGVSGVPDKATTPFVVTKNWGYTPVGAEGEPELYNLWADPLGGENVAADHPQVVEELHERLLEHLAQHDAPEEELERWRSAPSD